ncbi:hypothetical protein [Phenylobacterium sp.]|uniref:hypothetical protein n=1 Tax=Phenylobacterium sp. TaxID=1871053 RepID=UPI002ED81B22
MASAAIKWMLLDHAAERPVQVGDVVSVEAGGMPIFRVVGLAGTKAWLDDEMGRVRRLTSLESFRWRGAGAA